MKIFLVLIMKHKLKLHRQAAPGAFNHLLPNAAEPARRAGAPGQAAVTHRRPYHVLQPRDGGISGGVGGSQQGLKGTGRWPTCCFQPGPTCCFQPGKFDGLMMSQSKPPPRPGPGQAGAESRRFGELYPHPIPEPLRCPLRPSESG